MWAVEGVEDSVIVDGAGLQRRTLKALEMLVFDDTLASGMKWRYIIKKLSCFDDASVFPKFLFSDQLLVLQES